MRKKRDKSPRKYKKSGYEVKFEQMVKEYHDAKETLESMKEGSEEYNKQKNLCES
ncbi:TPA: hypothetical protein NKT47_004741, partial [Vibrio parahaemolyticus]|nr:hypothetical protein [Vibrio parahaemolyticus]